MRLTGAVASGLGRAHVFMAQSHYQEQFKELLGATAWPGTLNVHLEGESLVRYLALRTLAGLESSDADPAALEASTSVSTDGLRAERILGFEREGRAFGGATAFRGRLSALGVRLPCAVLIPDLTRHTDVVEVIATEFLREAMDLRDSDEVRLDLNAV